MSDPVTDHLALDLRCHVTILTHLIARSAHSLRCQRVQPLAASCRRYVGKVPEVDPP